MRGIAEITSSFSKRSRLWAWTLQEKLRVQFGKPADSYYPLKSFWPQGKPSKGMTNWIHWANDIPCSERRFSSGKEGLKSTVTLLCKRQEHQVQLWPGTPPTKSKGVPLVEGALLLEGSQDLSTYNWNSFGLRYGKRQAVKAQEKSRKPQI
ncbi:metastasis-suppressor KiSS-1 [Erythrolamprus reginae]|uniref:metastasis-suppressor KiSS-1 n=1 Tax=Erythrolamprus reginae TaxID=121349 RepID=UPI00396CF0C0